MDNKKKRELFKSMTSKQRKELINQKIKSKRIEVGSGVPNKTYYEEDKEINELIKIVNCFPQLRYKKRNKDL